MTSLLALFSLIGTAFAGSNGDKDGTDQNALETTEEETVETVTTTESYVPDWVSVLDVLTIAPASDETMPEMAEEEDVDGFFFV